MKDIIISKLLIKKAIWGCIGRDLVLKVKCTTGAFSTSSGKDFSKLISIICLSKELSFADFPHQVIVVLVEVCNFVGSRFLIFDYYVELCVHPTLIVEYLEDSN